MIKKQIKNYAISIGIMATALLIANEIKAQDSCSYAYLSPTAKSFPFVPGSGCRSLVNYAPAAGAEVFYLREATVLDYSGGTDSCNYNYLEAAAKSFPFAPGTNCTKLVSYTPGEGAVVYYLRLLAAHSSTPSGTFNTYQPPYQIYFGSVTGDSAASDPNFFYADDLNAQEFSASFNTSIDTARMKLYLAGASEDVFQVNNNQGVILSYHNNSKGNVTILGTTNSNYQLQLDDSATGQNNIFSSNRFQINNVSLNFPTQPGAPGQVLTKGSGALSSWVTPAAAFVAYPPTGDIAYGSITATDSMSYEHHNKFYYSPYGPSPEFVCQFSIDTSQTGLNVVGGTGAYITMTTGRGRNYFLEIDSSGANNCFKTNRFQFGNELLYFPTTAGTNGQVLTKGSGALTSWQTPNATQNITVNVSNANLTCTTGKRVLFVNISFTVGGSIATFSLPTSSQLDGDQVIVSSTTGTALSGATISPTPTVITTTTPTAGMHIIYQWDAGTSAWNQIQ